MPQQSNNLQGYQAAISGAAVYRVPDRAICGLRARSIDYPAPDDKRRENTDADRR
jgi:hypothetical protein